MKQARPDVPYFAFDLGQEAQNKPELISGMLRHLIHEFEQETLSPLPRRVFLLQEVPGAFRFMAQAKHIGKIVVKQDAGLGLSSIDRDRFRADCSYLITGGLGGLGLQVAQWMVERGARHLALMGRSGTSTVAQAVVNELERSGTQVLVIKADVAQADQVIHAFEMIEQSMPPLRGIVHAAGIIDLVTHRLIDILPDREAESVKLWLLAHPEIDIVSRDRGGAYADGAAQGAPQAQQIADRWHLCKNLGDAVEEYITRQKIQIPPLSLQETASQEISATATPAPLFAPIPCQHPSQEKRERKQKLVDQVRTMHEEGKSIHTIATQLDLARNTVRRYLRLEEPAQPKLRPRKSNLLDPYYDYLCQRFKEGCSNASQLFEELQEKGYRRGKITVRNFVARLHKGLPGMPRPPKHAKNGAPASALILSLRELRWLLSKREEELTLEEKSDLMRLLESSQSDLTRPLLYIT